LYSGAVGEMNCHHVQFLSFFLVYDWSKSQHSPSSFFNPHPSDSRVPPAISLSNFLTSFRLAVYFNRIKKSKCSNSNPDSLNLDELFPLLERFSENLSSMSGVVMNTSVGRPMRCFLTYVIP
jgi:hypothetical protein